MIEKHDQKNINAHRLQHNPRPECGTLEPFDIVKEVAAGVDSCYMKADLIVLSSTIDAANKAYHVGPSLSREIINRIQIPFLSVLRPVENLAL